MNEIAVLDQQEINNAIAKVDILQKLVEHDTTSENAAFKKEASLQLAQISKLLDSKRAEATKPALDEQRRINGIFKPVIEKVDSLSKKLIGQVAEFARLEEKKIAEQRALQAKQDAEALLANKTIAPKSGIAAPSVTVSETKTWTYEAVNEDEIPREFMQPDDNKINGAIKAGKRHIPGLKIYQKTITGRR